jgi:hypothetical protein
VQEATRRTLSYPSPPNPFAPRRPLGKSGRREAKITAGVDLAWAEATQCAYATRGTQMNIKAIEWARAQTSLSILEKSILMLLASLADDYRFVEGQSQQAIADMVGCSRSSANRALNALARGGRIRMATFLVNADGQLPCIYLLNCADAPSSNRIAAGRSPQRPAA